MPHQCTGCGYTFADGSKEMLGGCPDCGGNTFQFYPEGSDVPEAPPETEEPPERDEPSGTASTVGRAATKVRDFVSGESAAAADDEPVDGVQNATEPTPDADPKSTSDADSAPATSAASETAPDANAPWPDSSDAADPIRKGGFADAEDDSNEDDLAPDEDGIIDADARATADAVEDAEDRAQSDARTGLASESDVEAAADAAEESGEIPPAASSSDTSSPDTADAPDTGLEAAETGAAPGEGRVVSEPSGEEADLADLREQLNDQFESIKILEPGQYELNLMELYDRDEYIIALQENGRYVIQVPEQWMGDRDEDR